MKHDPDLIAQRVVAAHCATLIRTGPSPEALLPGFGDRLAAELRATLPGLLGETGAIVSCAAPAIGPDRDRLAAAQPCAIYLFATASGQPTILASIDGRAVISLVDRSFGGPAGGDNECPKEFPSSARLMIARVETMLLTALKRALYLDEDGVLHCPARSRELPTALPFAHDCRTAELVLTITEPGHRPWTVSVVLLCAALDQLFGHRVDGAPGAGLIARSGDPAGDPWGDISLSLSAVLVDMNIPIGAVSQLEPGQLIPVTVARTLPLRIGRMTLARGTVGAIDGRLAVQLSSTA